MVERNIKIPVTVVIFFIIIFTVDTLFFRHLFWERLIANIGIVIVFLVLYMVYLNK
jgi:hypothetical protein